eukprot:179286-Chlamydomonas_euryale.AAC.7
MEDRPTPSVNYELMGRFVGQKVRLVCEIDGPGDGSVIRGRCVRHGLCQVRSAQLRHSAQLK